MVVSTIFRNCTPRNCGKWKTHQLEMKCIYQDHLFFKIVLQKKKTVGVRVISSNHHFYRLVSEPPLFYSQDYNHHQKGFQKRLRNLATRFALNAPGNASWRSKGSCVGLFWERELFTTKAAYLDLPVWVPNGFVTDLFNSPSLRFFFSDGHPEKGEGAA